MIHSGYIFSLAYLAGLLLSGTGAGWQWSLGIGAIAMMARPWLWRAGPPRYTLIIATVIAIAAGGYLRWRTPTPTLHNVSHWVSSGADTACISGTLRSAPQLNRRGQLKAELKAATIQISRAAGDSAPDESGDTLEPSSVAVSSAIAPTAPPTGEADLSPPATVEGRLYLTLPLLQGTGLYPHQPVRACGRLYAPRPALNPAGFDFAAYLARQGIFAGLSATTITPIDTTAPPLLWRLRQRIVRAFVTPLGSPHGVLLSAMVLGRRAVDLPYDVRDAFAQVGLAHTLAASGFYVSLLLGLFLALTRRLSAAVRLWLGIGLLLGYAGLTGLQPSICRAVAMGAAGLWGETLERRTQPVALLLAIAVGILLLNPIWIWDLGFQLSFLATLGLLVTVPPLTQWLDGLPTGVATAIAVPAAASVWTLPLQLWAFSTLSPYSPPLNAAVTLLVSLISLIGMSTAAVALISSELASAIAPLLHWPIEFLLAIVTWVNQLPGRQIALGQSLPQMGSIYAALGVMTQVRPRRQMLLAGIAVALLLVPGWWVQRHLVQVTVLAGRTPTVVVQDHGQVGLIGLPAADLAFGLQPFLRRQGVNRVDWAIDLSEPSGNGADGSASTPRNWNLAISVEQSYAAEESWQGATFGGATLQRVSQLPRAVHLTLGDQHWLIVGSFAPGGPTTPGSDLVRDHLPPGYTLVWSGAPLPAPLDLSPAAAIATSDAADSDAVAHLEDYGTTAHVAGRDGAVQWRLSQGHFTPIIFEAS